MGRVIVGWRDSNQATYISRIDGDAWDKLGWSDAPGIQTAQAVWGSSSDLWAIDVAVDASGRPIATWNEEHASGTEIIVARYSGVVWEGFDGSPMGENISPEPGDAGAPSLALDAAGNPVVAWTQDSAVWVKRFNGTAWVEIDGSATAAGLGTAAANERPSIAVDSLGTIFVAWAEDVPVGPAIYVAVSSGSGWSGVAGSYSGDGLERRANKPTVAIDPSDIPVVAFYHTTPGGGLEVYRGWSSISWVTASPAEEPPSLAFSSSGSIFFVAEDGRNYVYEDDGSTTELGEFTAGIPRLVVDGSDVLMTVMADFTGPVLASRWDPASSSFEGFGATGTGSGPPSGFSPLGDLAIGPLGYPAVATERRAYVHDGVDFTPLTGATSVGDPFWNVTLAVDRYERPTLATSMPVPFGDELRVFRYDCSSWVELTTFGAPLAEGFSRDLSLDLSFLDGHQPVIAWEDGLVGGVFVSIWEGEWRQLGGSLSSGNPLSSIAWNPAVDAQSGTIWVAWTGRSTGHVVYTQYWDGTAWQEVARSSSDGITPQPLARIDGVHIVTDSAGAPVVAWHGHDGAGFVVGGRRLRGTSWVSAWDPAPATEIGPFELGLTPSDEPVVAWRDASGTFGNAFMKLYDGSTWVEIDGSASGGGVSNSTGTLFGSVGLTTDPRKICVGWRERLPNYIGSLTRCADWP